MKDCTTIRPLLSEYVDGVLDENKAWEVKMHLSTCSVCEQVASDFASTARLLSGLPQAQPSANFEAMLAKRLADEVLQPRRRSLMTVARDWWEERWRVSGVSFASGAAVTAVVSVVFFMSALRPSITVPVPPRQTPVAVTSPASESETLNELWHEHDAYASSVSLGDRATLLTAGDGGAPTL